LKLQAIAEKTTQDLRRVLFCRPAVLPGTKLLLNKRMMMTVSESSYCHSLATIQCPLRLYMPYHLLIKQTVRGTLYYSIK